jgi:uncharacterized protein
MLAGALLCVFGLLAPQIDAPQRPVSTNSLFPPTQVRTTGTATRTVAPDLAVLRFEFSARDTTPSAAAHGAATIGEAIRKAVAKTGVPNDSILGRGSLGFANDQTVQIEVKPNSEFKRYDTTYVFRDMTEVRIRDLKRVSGAIDAALLAGAQKLLFLQFSSSRTQQIGQEAVEEATRQARRNAELMAQAAGGKLGRPLELTTDRNTSGDAFYDIRAAQTSPTTSGVIAAPPGAELRVSVYGRWELLSGGD